MQPGWVVAGADVSGDRISKDEARGLCSKTDPSAPRFMWLCGMEALRIVVEEM